MRPLLVLALVIGALGALLFAVLRVQPGGSTPSLPGGPEGPVASAPGGPADPAPLAPVAGTGPDATAPRGDAPTRETLGGAEPLTYENALAGRVVDQGGSPVERARVVLTKASSMAVLVLDDPGDRSRDRRAFTDAEGRYRFEHVEPYDFYSLVVTHDDYSRATATNVRVGERGEYTEQDIRLLRGSTLAGYVRDENGTGIAGALLALYQGPQLAAGDGLGERMLARTDGQGRYTIENIAPGLYNLDVRADGFGNVTATNQSFRRSKQHEKDFTLQVAGMIGGRVLGPDGGPLPGATVRATSYGGAGKQISRGEAITDAKGAFRLGDLRPGTFALIASASGYRPERAERVETGDLGVTVRLQRRSVVSGRVLAADGSPATRGRVELRTSHEHSPRTSPAGIAAEISDAQGRYELRGVPPGTYVVDAEAPGHAPTFSAPFTVVEDQSGGRDVPGIDVQLTRGGAILGRVVDPDGEPVQGARVTTHDNDWGDDPLARLLGADFPTNTTARAVRSDADGEFRLARLRPAIYQVRIHSDDYCTEMRYDLRVIEGGELRLGEVRLARGGIVRGTLFDKSGERLAGGELKLDASASPARPVIFQTKSDPEGRYEFRGVPPGAYTLSATLPPGPDVDPLLSVLERTLSERPVIVSENEVTHQDMTLGG